jgi:hypothetical protein
MSLYRYPFVQAFLQEELITEVLSHFIEECTDDKLPKVKNYVEETVHHFGDKCFRQVFRISPTSFEKLCFMLSEQWPGKIGGRPKIDFSKVLLFLKFLGGQDSLLSLSQLFDVSVSSAHKIIHDILSTFVSQISAQLIQWPSFQKQEDIAKSN